VFARKEHPLALFLDDLQWLDTATLDLLEHLVTHLMFDISSGRGLPDNEVDPRTRLWRTLEAIREAGGRVEQIILAPLALDDVGRSSPMPCTATGVRAPLAQMVHEKTGGNPFFAIQFFIALADQGCSHSPLAQAWGWDIDRIRARATPTTWWIS